MPSLKSLVSGKWWTLLFISICKFGRFNNTFATFTSLPEVCFRFRGFVLSVQTIKLDLIFMMGDIYRNYNLNPLRKCTSSCRSTAFSDFLSWNISQRITKTIPINKKIDISYAMKWVSCFEFERKSMGIETTTWSEFPSGGKVVVEQILASRNK